MHNNLQIYGNLFAKIKNRFIAQLWHVLKKLVPRNNSILSKVKHGVKGLPMARNVSLTFSAVFADVSKNSKPFSSAYACAS